MSNLKERATTPLKLERPKMPTGWVDLITGKPVSKEEMDKCPSCGTNAVVSNYPSEENCLKCGWSND